MAARHAPAVNAILEEADGLTDRALQIQAIAGRVMALLESEGLVSRELVAPQNVGVHPCNRNGAMLDPHHVHELLAMFVLKGFNPGECRQALAAQISPGDDGAKERAKNEQLTKRSYNLLAPCQGDRLNTPAPCSVPCSAATKQGSKLPPLRSTWRGTTGSTLSLIHI